MFGIEGKGRNVDRRQRVTPVSLTFTSRNFVQISERPAARIPDDVELLVSELRLSNTIRRH